MGTLQLRRLTTTNRLLIIPANGEPIYDLDLKIIYIGDGSTLGGVNPIATTNEVITGSDGTRIVTPAGLTSKIDTDISLAGNSNTRIASQAATKAYVDALAGSINALIYKGVIDCSTTPNYPAADAGHVYIVSVAGKIGGASGTVVAAGDLLLCKVDSSAAGTEAAVGANWDVLEKNIDLTNILISGGAIDNTLIGNTTPAMGRFSPLKAKGPAIITTFAGTISTSGSSTTITFTSAADAILAGYDANNPLLGTTLITTAVNQASVTRYVQSWTNSTQCVVDTACTLAASSTLASVQAPIMVFVNSAGVVQGWMNAAGKIYCVGNLGIGNANPSSIVSMYKSSGSVQFEIASGTTLSYIGPSSSTWDIWSQANFPFVITMNSAELFRVLTNGNFLIGGITAAGTSGAKVLGLGEGTAPTTSPADMSQLWSADIGGVAGNNSLHMRNEYGSTGPVGFAVPPERVKASTIALDLTDANGKLINNYGQANNCIYTLPACAANLAFDFIAGTTVAKYLRLTAAAGDALTLDGVKGADAGSIQFVSVAEGNAFSARSYQTGAASWDWMVTTISGPLVVV